MSKKKFCQMKWTTFEDMDVICKVSGKAKELENKNNGDPEDSPQESDVEFDGQEEVMLIVGDENFVCQKKELWEKSAYFKAMFKGNFLERDQKIIEIKGVTSKSMRDLLNLSQNPDYLLECEDIYSVLAACNMLLFEDLKKWIVSQLDLMVNPDNCLKMWVELQLLEITSLCWKIKSICLQDFNKLRTNGTITNLDEPFIYNYLGHVNLQCDNELHVFQSAMEWYRAWYPNRPKESLEILTLMRLLCVIDFKHASLPEILEMKSDPHVQKHPEIMEVFESILKLRSEETLEIADSDRIIELNLNNGFVSESACRRLAQSLTDSRARYFPKYPSFLVRTCEYVKHIENCTYTVIHYDPIGLSLRKIAQMPVPLCDNLTGFGMQDLKMKFYIFGGEYSLGKGSWNREIWSFDMVYGHKTKLRSMPKPRRHFEYCTCGDYLYIVGGTGPYGVIQDNMYWYDFEKDTWSKEIVLPCSGRQIKCCNINKELFIFSLSDKCGYFFNRENVSWKKVPIKDSKGRIPKVITPFSIFLYNDNLFLKGDKLVQMEFLKDKLRIVKITSLPHFYEDHFVETVSCNNYVYTLYKHKGADADRLSLEYLNLDTMEINYIHEFDAESSQFIAPCKLQDVVKLFMFHHHSLVRPSTMVFKDTEFMKILSKVQHKDFSEEQLYR